MPRTPSRRGLQRTTPERGPNPEFRDGGTEPGPLIALGKLGRSHGLQGELRLFPYSEGDNLLAARQVYVAESLLGIEHVRATKDCLLIKFAGIDTPEAAARLTHAEVALPRACLPPLAEGEYYWVDLIGLECRAGPRSFGRVREVFEAGAHPILLAEDETGHQEMIPFVMDAIVRSVDLERQLIEVDWAGLD